MIAAVLMLLQAAAAEPANPAMPPEPAPVAEQPACAPGVYSETGSADAPTIVAISRQTIEKRQVANVGGFLLTGGISGLKIKQVLPGAAAATRIAAPRPAFRFCFEPPQAVQAGGDGSAYVGASRTAASPAEFRLVLFEGKREQRELVIARTRMLAGIRGTMADASLRFQSAEIAPGQYRVSLDYDLPPGEYGFLLAAGGGDFRDNRNQSSAGAGGAQQGEAQVYDFAVTRPNSAR